MTNDGYNPEEIANLKQDCLSAGKNHLLLEDEGQLPELKHFYFVGKFEGQEVIYDAVIYTLEMYYSSMLYEAAEEAAKEEYPNYVPWELEVDKNGVPQPVGEVDEEVEEFKASVIMELQEDDDFKVSEAVFTDVDFDFGVGLEAILNVKEVTEEVITKFVTEYNAGTLQLDQTRYSFELDEEE